MATVLRENIGLLNDKLTVQIAKTDYLPAFEQSLKKYAKTANMPGFRKGMVPTGMVKKLHGASVFTDEVLKTVEKELNSYMEQEQLEIFAQPLPLESDARQLDMNNPADYSFAFEIGLKPPININPADINVVFHKVEITDDMIAHEIESIKERFGTVNELETVENEETFLETILTEADAEGLPIVGGISKTGLIQLKLFKPEIISQLIGNQKTDTITIQPANAFLQENKKDGLKDLGFEDSMPNEQASFILSVSGITTKAVAEINEALFQSVFPDGSITNEEDFRNAVKQGLQQNWDSQSRNQLHDQIYHYLVDETAIQFPDNFLKRWIQDGGEKRKTPEEAEEEYPKFEKSLKWTLISNQLLAQYDIKVEPAEIKNYAKQQIVGYMNLNTLDEAPWLDSYAESMLKDKKFIENTYYQLQTAKLFNMLEGQVTVAEQPITREALHELQHNHQH